MHDLGLSTYKLAHNGLALQSIAAFTMNSPHPTISLSLTVLLLII